MIEATDEKSEDIYKQGGWEISLTFQRYAELRKQLKKVDTNSPEQQVPSSIWFSGKLSITSSSGNGGPLGVDNSCQPRHPAPHGTQHSENTNRGIW